MSDTYSTHTHIHVFAIADSHLSSSHIFITDHLLLIITVQYGQFQNFILFQVSKFSRMLCSFLRSNIHFTIICIETEKEVFVKQKNQLNYIELNLIKIEIELNRRR